eukprot:10207123-Lingulodinium_polyedra.AAC.1
MRGARGEGTVLRGTLGSLPRRPPHVCALPPTMPAGLPVRVSSHAGTVQPAFEASLSARAAAVARRASR